MASSELLRLWKLAQIDNRLVEIRRRAAAFDPGGKIAEEVKRLESEEAEVGGKARALHAEQRDIELRQKTIQDKLAKVEKQLFSGLAIGPRMAENLEKEKASLKRQLEGDDERLMELFDIVPPAQAEAKKAASELEEGKKRLALRLKESEAERIALHGEFTKLTAERAEKAKLIPPALLVRYDAIRQRSGGIGMVEALKGICAGCGTNLPERTLQALREDKQATCEACHRLLYYTDGVI